MTLQQRYDALYAAGFYIDVREKSHVTLFLGCNNWKFERFIQALEFGESLGL